jgi:hypothetical protein
MKAIQQVLSAALISIAFGPAAHARDSEPLPTVPPALAVPAGNEVEVKFAASGVQIYRCLPSAQVATEFAWTFVAPEATLFDKAGKVAGRHYAGPTWEANDGSKIVGKVAAKAPSPDGTSIPWLLLTATVVQAGETFEHIGFVQRLRTSGGSAPASGCTSDAADTEVRVPYTADYYFYSAH